MDSVKWVQCAPWRKYRNALDADGDLPEGVKDEESEVPDPNRVSGDPRVVYIQTRSGVLREFKISQEDLFGPDGASRKDIRCPG
eukprot:6010623-Karenia_brevis.AAC.1